MGSREYQDILLVKQLLVLFQWMQVECVCVRGSKGDVLFKTGNGAIWVVSFSKNIATIILLAGISGIFMG